MIAHEDYPLIVETQELICSRYQTHDSSSLSAQGAPPLKNTIHLNALSAALLMARSHHAIAIEGAIIGKEEATFRSKQRSDQVRVAISITHHLVALILIRETQHLRLASHRASRKGRKFPALLKKAAKKVMIANRVVPVGGRFTLYGCDLSTVSCANKRSL